MYFLTETSRHVSRVVRDTSLGQSSFTTNANKLHVV